MDWQEEYNRKLVSAEKAVQAIKSGDRVVIPLGQNPQLIPRALTARKDELRNVEIFTCSPATDYGWLQPGWEESFPINLELFIGNTCRPMMDERRGDFTPNLFTTEFKAWDEKRPGYRELDVLVVVVSPPDRNGFCSFGHALWDKKDYTKRAKKVLAEVDNNQIRTFGDNFIHASEIDYFVEYTPPVMSKGEIEQLLAKADPEKRKNLRPLIPQIDQVRLAQMGERLLTYEPEDIARFLGLAEPEAEVKQIAEHVSTLIRDGDTIQVGLGGTSGQLPRAGVFDNKHDLGLHTELVVDRIIKLVKEGVITGKYKTLHNGKAVASSFFPGADAEDLEFIADNPMFAQYSTSYVLDLRIIAAHDNMVAINNALSVDLTGQIAVETTMGFRLWNGPGGQPEFAIGAMMSKGGRSITVLPSTALDGAVSRIVPLLEEGVMVTVPRSFADYVVSEYGIASLLGKSQRQRAEELINIAHPDFRAELSKKAKKLFYPL